MKLFHSSIFRALCAIAVGILILMYAQDGVKWLTIAVGFIFLTSGVVSLAIYWVTRQHASEYNITDQQGRVISNGQPTFPIVGAGSIILGLVLVLVPERFIDGLMYVLGGIMILGGIQQIVNLFVARRLGNIPFGYWVMPVLIMLTGLFAILYPMETAELPLLILGGCSLAYGLTEFVNTFVIWRMRRIAKKMAAERNAIPEAEEVSSELGA